MLAMQTTWSRYQLGQTPIQPMYLDHEGTLHHASLSWHIRPLYWLFKGHHQLLLYFIPCQPSHLTYWSDICRIIVGQSMKTCRCIHQGYSAGGSTCYKRAIIIYGRGGEDLGKWDFFFLSFPYWPPGFLSPPRSLWFLWHQTFPLSNIANYVY